MKAARIFALALVALLSGLNSSVALAVAAGALAIDLLLALLVRLIASTSRSSPAVRSGGQRPAPDR